MTNTELRTRYVANRRRCAMQVCSVHGHLTAADIEERNTLKAEMNRRGLSTKISDGELYG